jgi:hypothetical protein
MSVAWRQLIKMRLGVDFITVTSTEVGQAGYESIEWASEIPRRQINFAILYAIAKVLN